MTPRRPGSPDDIAAASFPERGTREDEERLCRGAGQLLVTTLPTGREPPAGQWQTVGQTLAAALPRAPGLSRRRHFAWGAACGVLLAGVGALLLWISRPVEVRARAGVTAGAGELYAATGGDGRLSFSDESVAMLGDGAALRIVSRSWRGANVSVERGAVAFSVRHRLNTSWRVAVGGSTVEITGTRFSVGVSARTPTRAWVHLLEGSVNVSGGVLGHRVTLQPGETLFWDNRSRRSGMSTRGEAPPDDLDAEDAEAQVAVNDPRTRAEDESSRERTAAPGTEPGTELGTEPGAEQGPAQGTERGTARATEHPFGSARPLPSMGARRAAKTDDSPGPPIEAPQHEPTHFVPARELSPPPFSLDRLPEEPRLGAGGGDCLDRAAQYDFETSTQHSFVDRYISLGFSEPALSFERSYCGRGALMVETQLAREGRLHPWGLRGHEWGSLQLKVGGVQDFTGRTVEAYVYVDAPEGTRFAAQLAAISATKFVLAERREDLTPKHWHRLSATFPAEVTLDDGSAWHVRLVDKLVIELQCLAGRPCWSGRAFFDHIGWH